jgi:hypothetical protein
VVVVSVMPSRLPPGVLAVFARRTEVRLRPEEETRPSLGVSRG